LAISSRKETHQQHLKGAGLEALLTKRFYHHDPEIPHCHRWRLGGFRSDVVFQKGRRTPLKRLGNFDAVVLNRAQRRAFGTPRVATPRPHQSRQHRQAEDQKPGRGPEGRQAWPADRATTAGDAGTTHGGNGGAPDTLRGGGASHAAGAVATTPPGKGCRSLGPAAIFPVGGAGGGALVASVRAAATPQTDAPGLGGPNLATSRAQARFLKSPSGRRPRRRAPRHFSRGGCRYEAAAGTGNLATSGAPPAEPGGDNHREWRAIAVSMARWSSDRADVERLGHRETARRCCCCCYCCRRAA
jgi:hypothetical protein